MGLPNINLYDYVIGAISNTTSCVQFVVFFLSAQLVFKGPVGEVGQLAGPKGEEGDRGVNGSRGDTGAKGQQGVEGTPGRDLQGPAGMIGEEGMAIFTGEL